MNLRQHLVDVLKINPAPSPFPRMFVCIFSSTIPLILGLYLNQLPIAIFGALTGFLLVLNDHMGSLGHRLWTISLTWLCMGGGLFLGILCQNNLVAQMITIAAPIYFLGLMGGGKGAELEKAILFGCFQFLAGSYTTHLQEELPLAIFYSFLGYFCVITFLSLLVFIRRHKPNPFQRMRTSLNEAIEAKPDRHFYAFGITLVMLLSLYWVNRLKIDHGYWAVGTILLIIRPELKNSLYRGIQRFIGTLFGVLAADVLITYLSNPWHAVPIIGILAFWGPWSTVRNYWLGSFIIVTMMLLILDLPQLGSGSLYIPLMRLTSTTLGCAIAMFSVIIFNLPTIFKKRRAGP